MVATLARSHGVCGLVRWSNTVGRYGSDNSVTLKVAVDGQPSID